ncbi:MAG: SDR family oxidoreductase [Desulfobacteraceae bacterium]|nr:SDR family oxidoreductase [Desulfobacteraceae bacterium]
MNIRLDGKVAVVTGAGRGLGKAYALDLASRGARVVVNDLGGAEDGSGESKTPAQEVVEEIKAVGGEAIADFNSVTEPEGARAIIQTALDSFGTVDILINNAGVLRDKTFLKMPLEDFEFVIRVHLMGTVYVTKAAFPIMREKGYGRIVLATSTAALYGNFGQTNYTAAKMGIVGFMNSLKEEGRRYNILVNTIAPLAASRLGVGIFPEDIMKFMRPQLVSSLVVYLCSDRCTSTGDIISAGIGYYAKTQMMECQGVRFEPKTDVTPEMVAEDYKNITSMEGARPFVNSGEAFLAVLGPLAPRRE